jgi:hypothetical protein
VVPRRQALRFDFFFAPQFEVDDAEASIFPGHDRALKRVFTLASGLATAAKYQRETGAPIPRSS